MTRSVRPSGSGFGKEYKGSDVLHPLPVQFDGREELDLAGGRFSQKLPLTEPGA